jgi:hypothetical protein
MRVLFVILIMRSIWMINMVIYGNYNGQWSQIAYELIP